jgi:hypothetical protein
MDKEIVKIASKNKLLALIIRAKFKQDGLKFFVPEECPQQIGYMKRPRGYVISSHLHSPVLRRIKLAQEVLFIRSGKLRIDFYDAKTRYLESRVVKQGDVVFIASGGHGFEFLEESEIIEVKQGPFIKGAGLLRFEAAKKEKIKLKR